MYAYEVSHSMQQQETSALSVRFKSAARTQADIEMMLHAKHTRQTYTKSRQPGKLAILYLSRTSRASHATDSSKMAIPMENTGLPTFILNHPNDRITTLLFTLPPELRLTIYELCLPFLQHRRSKVLADYISDSHWMAISPTIFRDAAPLVFSKRLVYIYTRLRQPTNLLQTFDDVILRSYPHDHEWIRPVARSMVRKLALTIRFPHLWLDGLPKNLSAYLTSVTAFTGLKELHISLGPEFLPANSLVQPTQNTAYDKEKLNSNIDGLATTFEPVATMLEVVAVVRRCVRAECKVVWKFDRAGMPDLPRRYHSQSTLQELTYFNEVMAWLWEYGDSVYTDPAPCESK